MAVCKSGEWWKTNSHYSLANNSAVYETKPSIGTYLNEMGKLFNSYSGERGIFNREASKQKAKSSNRRDHNFEFGSNPCCEIILRPFQFCNLSEVVIKHNDDEESILDKIKIATIIGTLQSRYTNFKFLRSIYKINCDEERLLGVSLTGIYDNELTYNPSIDFLKQMKNLAIYYNELVARKLNINQSTSITCVKPSGTVSALCGSASGIHPRHSEYYIRRVRALKTCPVAKLLKFYNVPHEDDVMNKDTYVFDFPIRTLGDPITKEFLKATNHFNLWKLYNEHFCEHKPSITISYKNDEFIPLINEMYESFDSLSGISLLPTSDMIYQQAPFEAITKHHYFSLIRSFPKFIDWKKLSKLEDNPNFFDEYAQQCSGGSCENF